MNFDEWWDGQPHVQERWLYGPDGQLYIYSVARKAWDAAVKAQKATKPEPKVTLIIGGSPGAAYNHMMRTDARCRCIINMTYYDEKTNTRYILADGYFAGEEDRLRGLRPNKIVLVGILGITSAVMEEVRHIASGGDRVTVVVVGYTHEVGYKVE